MARARISGGARRRVSPKAPLTGSTRRRTEQDYRVAFVMAANQEQSEAIARALVGERLAACVNIVGPVRSVYRWRDAIKDESEYMLIIKTRTRLFTKLERLVRELHSYEVPEIITVPISAGSKPYLEWLQETTAPITASAARPRV
ncbi:MAG: divalent-cation tolerance protein CutA [Candidatus Binataceae bacterium]